MLKVSDDIKRVLLATGGSQNLRFFCEVIRDGAKMKDIQVEGSVSLDIQESIERSAHLTIYEEIDWLHDQLRPCVNYPDIEVTYPLGQFIPSTPTKNADENGAVSYDVEAYDKTIILREDCLTDPLYFPANTRYDEALEGILVGAGADTVIFADRPDQLFPTDREFEEGTEKLAIINSLLQEINFNKIRCDGYGRFVISKFVIPTIDHVGFEYKADNLSVIKAELSSSFDLYKVPNIFKVTVSNPDMESGLSSLYINDSPDSITSTVSRGRKIVMIVDPPDVVASQEDLDAYINRIAFEQSQAADILTFHTGIMPIHESGDVLSISHPYASGVYQETSWTIDLSDQGGMTHIARRVDSIVR